MMTFKKEFSLGTIATIIGYLVAALFFVFQTRAEVDVLKAEMRVQFENLKQDTNRLEETLRILSYRVDQSIYFNGPVPPPAKK
jgi:hypothetical protein